MKQIVDVYDIFSGSKEYSYYVSQMQALGVDLATIQSMVGHADLDMTQHYLHVQSPIKQKAVEAFNEAFFGNHPHSSQIPVGP